MALILMGRTQLSVETPFDNGANGFSATEAQSAIEEAKATAPGTAARYVVMAGFDGNASATRWLEFNSNVASNLSPYVAAEPYKLMALSLSTSGKSTCTVTIYKNGVAAATVSTAGTSKAYVSGLNILYAAGDTMSMAVTSGSCSKPVAAANCMVT